MSLFETSRGTFTGAALLLFCACGAPKAHAPARSNAPAQQPDVSSEALPPAPEEQPHAAPAPAGTPSSPPAAPLAVTPSPAAPVAEKPASGYSTPLVDEATLTHQSKQACERARALRRPLLVEFSADWCSDCVVLAGLKTRSPLAEEMTNWEWLSINIGDGDQHPELMRAFRVKEIARLVVLEAKDCAAPLRLWRPVASRTLSGIRGNHDELSRSLTAWLAQNRR